MGLIGSWSHGAVESPECPTSPRQVITDGTVSLSKESSDSVSSVPPAAHYIDNHNDISGGNVISCGKTPLRPDVAAAVPMAVPGRFGRGFGRTPGVTPTAGGVHHDCRTFGCFRQAAGPGSATAARHPAGEFHCCVMCLGTALECSSGAKVDLWRCFLLPRLVMGGNGAGWPSEPKET